MKGDPTYRVRIGSQEIEIPLVAIADDLTIALLISVDLGIEFSARAGTELSRLLAPSEPEIVVSVATMGIPLAIEVSRALGFDDYVILHKTQKIHLADAIAEPVKSITTAAPQRLLFDRNRMPAVVGRRVAVVDDVISTGASTRAALNLLRGVGAVPVAVGALVTEGSMWRDILAEDVALVRALGSMPLFRPGPGGSLREQWDDVDATDPTETPDASG